MNGGGERDATVVDIDEWNADGEGQPTAEVTVVDGQLRRHTVLEAETGGAGRVLQIERRIDDRGLVDRLVGRTTREVDAVDARTSVTLTVDWVGAPPEAGERLREHVPTDGTDAVRVSVEDVTEIGGVGLVASCRVEQGELERGDELVAAGGHTVTVREIEMHHEAVPRAEEGDVVGLQLAGETGAVGVGTDLTR